MTHEKLNPKRDMFRRLDLELHLVSKYKLKSVARKWHMERYKEACKKSAHKRTLAEWEIDHLRGSLHFINYLNPDKFEKLLEKHKDTIKKHGLFIS